MPFTVPFTFKMPNKILKDKSNKIIQNEIVTLLCRSTWTFKW